MSPGPSSLHITCPSDDFDCSLDDFNCAPGSVAHPLDDFDLDEEVNPKVLTKWDLHAGIKPLEFGDGASDKELEVEDDIPNRAKTKVSNPMVKMMAKLDDNDEWLPWNEQKKQTDRIKGEIIHSSNGIEGTHCLSREKKTPLPWA